MLQRSRIFLVAGLFASLALIGCAKSNQGPGTKVMRTTTSAPGTQAKMNKGTQIADLDHGKAVFAQNCASCHGANGAGGPVGPALKNEKSKKAMAAAISWIKNPQPPMPKLYPVPLGEKDVTDVAAYVESL